MTARTRKTRTKAKLRPSRKERDEDVPFDDFLPPEPVTPMDLLGRVVGESRDNVIGILESEATRPQKSATSRAVQRALSKWPKAARRDLPDVVAHVVDLALHSLLVNLEAEYDLRVMARNGTKWVDLREASAAGLHYELYGPEGWVRRFSGYPRGRFERSLDDF